MAGIALSMLSKLGASGPITCSIRLSQVSHFLTLIRPTSNQKASRTITVQCTRSGVSTEDFDLKGYTKPLVESVNRELDKLIPVSDDKVEEAMRYAVMGRGKRSCPVMCIAACEAVGGRREEALPVACAMEMIHAASLILDDLPCMDDSHRLRPRRRHSSQRRTLRPRVRPHCSPLLRRPNSAQSRLRAREGRGIHWYGGRPVRRSGQRGELSIEPALLESIHRHKSALMGEISVVGGRIAGGGSDEEVERLRSYGRSVGLAYQIVDDMLDLNGTTEELRKTAGKDKRVGKVTYHEVFGMEKCRDIVLDLGLKAQDCISQFDPLRAAPLVGFAQFVIARNF